MTQAEILWPRQDISFQNFFKAIQLLVLLLSDILEEHSMFMQDNHTEVAVILRILLHSEANTVSVFIPQKLQYCSSKALCSFFIFQSIHIILYFSNRN